MLVDSIHKLLHKDGPFQPFRVHLSSGATIEVPHPDYAFLPWHRRYLMVETSDNLLRINFDQITHVEEASPLEQPEIGSETGKRN